MMESQRMLCYDIEAQLKAISVNRKTVIGPLKWQIVCLLNKLKFTVHAFATILAMKLTNFLWS